MRALACQLLATAAAAFDVLSVKVLSSQLLPTGFAFGNATLQEVSACRFAPATRDGRRDATLLSDRGALFAAAVDYAGDSVHVTPLAAIPLDRPADSEGLAYAPGEAHELFVSTEMHHAKDQADELDILAVDARTGHVLGSPFAVPEDVLRRVQSNAGFEGVTVSGGGALGLDAGAEFLVTTTEYALAGDRKGAHAVLAWALPGDVEKPEEPVASRRYEASTYGSKPLGVVEFEALEDSLLVLERGFHGTDTIRLFEAQWLGGAFAGAFAKRLLVEWDAAGLRDGDENTISSLPVDNYEAMCLVPADDEVDSTRRRRLLLANDDNGSDEQIGTQFVLLELKLGAVTPAPTPGKAEVVEPARGAAWRAALLLAAAAARYAVARRRAFGEPTIRGDPGVVLSNLRFTEEDLDVDGLPSGRPKPSARSRMGAAAKSLRGKLGNSKKGYARIERRPSTGSEDGLELQPEGDFL